MKSLVKTSWVKAAAILLVAGLASCFGEAQAADWKEFTEATTGVFHYDAADVRSPLEGFVRVWIHNSTKKETSLLEFDCKNNCYRVLDVIQYDEAGRIRGRETYYDNPTPTWFDIEPNSVPRPLRNIVCR